MSQIEPTAEGKIPSLIGVFRRLVAEDPIIALIAIVIMFPLGAGIASAALTGRFDDMWMLILAEGAVVIICIPLIFTKIYKQSQTEIRKARTTAIETEGKSRILVQENKQKRFNQLVAAQIGVLDTKKDFILGQSFIEDRKIFRETMEALHETLKSGQSVFVSQVTFTETVQKILQDLSIVYNELETAKNETIDGPTPIKQEPLPYSPDRLEDLEQRLADYKANYEAQGRTIADFQVKISEYEANIAEVRELNAQLQQEKEDGFVHEFIPQATPELILDEVAVLKAPPELTPTEKLPPPAGYDDFSQTEEKKENRIVATVKKVVGKITPEKTVLTDALNVLGNLRDSSEDDIDIPTDPIEEVQEVQEIVKPQPVFWVCPKCQKGNNMKKVRCPQCGTGKPIES